MPAGSTRTTPPVDESTFRTLIDTIADGVVIIDDDGITCYANPAAERLFGRSAGELVGEEFGHPVAAGDAAEIDLLNPDRGPVIAELRVTRTEWEGRPAYLAAIRDVTDQRRAEQHERELVREQALRAAAEQSERRARFLGEASSLLVQSFDSGVALQTVAELAVPFLADWCLVDVVADDGLERAAIATASTRGRDLCRRLRNARPHVQADSGALRALREHGPQLAASATAPAVAGVLGIDPGHEDVAAARLGACIVVPLTARDRPLGLLTLIDAESDRTFDDDDLDLATELARRIAVAIDNGRLYRETLRANQAKADFLAVMSHELRTPLNAIIGYADLLTMGVPEPVPDPSVEQVRRIRTSARHLLGLIEEILTFSRVEAGREELHIESASIDDLFAEVADLFQLDADQAGIELTFTAADDVGSIRTDVQKLRQILINLVSNALKFTEQGSVRIAAERDDSAVLVTVRDTGRGIDDADLGRIFEPFWQAEQSKTRRAEGTGLGLAVARRLAHLLGGDIAVRSTPGRGSTFTLHLPLKVPRQTPP